MSAAANAAATLRYRAGSKWEPLWWAGGGLCGICGRDLQAPDIGHTHDPETATVDHVIPRRPRGQDAGKLHALRALIGGYGSPRLVMAHGRCNGTKGNRLPTGCEMVFLMAVNARLYDRKPKRRVARVPDIG